MVNRSEINDIIVQLFAFFAQHSFPLPPFARWKVVDWLAGGERVCEIVERRLGWDVTDFGQGTFDKVGLGLFTLRNGLIGDLERGKGMLYAEKVMLVRINQVTPMHYHRNKTEDIIDRGEGTLAIKLYPRNDDDSLGSDDIAFVSDGMQHIAPAGHVVRLRPGESVTITPYMYHSFWAEGQPVLASEISTVNDDVTDNQFLEKTPRFPLVNEDELPNYLLISDYKRYIRACSF